MDTSLYRTVNRFADRTFWLHSPAVAYAKYGVVIFAGLLLLAWWRARQGGDLETEARIGWAGVATLISLGLGQIIGHLVDRARPYAVDPALVESLDGAPGRSTVCALLRVPGWAGSGIASRRRSPSRSVVR